MAYKKPVRLQGEKPTTAQGKRLLSLRRTVTVGFDWAAVDDRLLRGALWACTLEGAALMFSTAAGGRGICLRVFYGEQKEVEYATDPEELNGLLESLIEQLVADPVTHLQLFDGTVRRRLVPADLNAAESVHADLHAEALTRQMKRQAAEGAEGLQAGDD